MSKRTRFNPAMALMKVLAALVAISAVAAGSTAAVASSWAEAAILA